jgi:hypothetical protein
VELRSANLRNDDVSVGERGLKELAANRHHGKWPGAGLLIAESRVAPRAAATVCGDEAV